MFVNGIATNCNLSRWLPSAAALVASERESLALQESMVLSHLGTKWPPQPAAH